MEFLSGEEQEHLNWTEDRCQSLLYDYFVRGSRRDKGSALIYRMR